MTIAIAGGGIAGLALGLTLHELGLPFRVHEAVARPGPLGVGVNLQPHAVRELMDLGLEGLLREVGVATRDYGFYSVEGREIWTEPRGRHAGYRWPQYSVHRGRLQMGLLAELRRRAGDGAVRTGRRLTGYQVRADGVCAMFACAEGGTTQVEADLLIAADGIRSAARAQMAPHEGEPIWNGAVLWRGTTRAAPFLSGASMILAGHDSARFVAYPITKPAGDGTAVINWIAELRRDPSQGWRGGDWKRTVDPAAFAPAFADWRWDWIDVPALIAGAGQVLEYPMVDRDPLDRWTDGPVTLIGDAAHPTYPVGSNGASQAIVDARALGAALRDHGVRPKALEAFEARIRPAATAIQRANRGEGPDAVLQWVHDLSGGRFKRVEDVIPRARLAAHADRYKRLAGYTVDQVNGRPGILAAGAE